LSAEAEANARLRHAHQSLMDLAAMISERERRGITREERAELIAAFPAVAAALGFVENVEKRLGAHKGAMETFVDLCMPNLDPDSLTAKTWGWIDEWTHDPDILRGEDDVRLRHRWAPKVVSLLRRVDALRRQLERAESLESRLDDQVRRLANWLTTEFKQPIPDWKLSGASFKGTEDGRLIFSLFFYVDDIELEHFTRQARVEGQIRREVARRLRKEGLTFAHPRYEVAFLTGGRGDADRVTRP
jgi:MscS family membrane protein